MKRSLYSELKRRNVIRAAVLYIGAVWAFGQGLSQFSPALGLPDWATRWFLVAAAIGFPLWTAFAWFYEFTPEGLKRESEIDPAQSITAHTGKKLDRWIIALMAVAIVLLLTNAVVWHRGAGLSADADRVLIPAHSIAVLPFVNMSDEKSQEYFADGISEDLLNLLAKVQTLQVAARTSSFSFKGRQVGISEIAKTLHVANVLEGSVRKSGNAVRITAQLIRAADGYEIWSQSWDRKLDDVFAIQDGIAADVVRELKVKLLGAVPTVRQTDPEAYALYLQARQLSYQASADALDHSDALYRQALAIDPRYAPAWLGLAGNFVSEAAFDVLPNDEGYRLAREATDKALAIEPDYAPVHAYLGRIASGQGDLAGAAQHLKRALALDPSDFEVLRNSAGLLRSLDRLEEAIAVNEFVAARDPVNMRVLFQLGLDYLQACRFDDAIAKFRTVLSLSPGTGIAHYYLGVALLRKRDIPAALAQMQHETIETWRLEGVSMACYGLGQKAESDAALTQLIDKHEKQGSYNIAYVYAYRGDVDKAFEWLDKAVKYADPGLVEIPTQILFDKIHADPRWLPFLRKIGKAPEQLAKIEFKVTLPQAEGSTTSRMANH
jgi:TolB-like protein/lipoprotein NlpI